ncbi:sulfatase family protein [Roseibacillus persicicus]|uniref:Arylsulfatase n=1 Tax=Roseibacillus persicicus TaxID=454148 RepID=A0A918TUY7_9BACT|nr:arylsulfatase [Roseibacillus persicicus]GHC63150.1 arylsulfatase [Roseibacillus persicicus]
MRFLFLTLLSLVGLQAERPNIVIMLSDDLGYGEHQHLNPDRGKIPTPHLDTIAASGMTFTDAHSGSSVCTPTRYGLLTGRYSWRTTLQRGVLTGGKSLIAEDRVTIGHYLKKQGYDTAIIGKWHLGTLYDGKHKDKQVPVGSKVSQGPIERGGFDLFRGFHHARQMDIWIEDQTVTEHLPPVEMLPRLTQEAVHYISSRKKEDAPFFLYLPWNSPHSPVVPSPEWQGKSGLNPHADFVMQTDDSHGQVMEALRTTGLLENTLVIVTSDNGTSAPTSKLPQLLEKGHHPSGPFRGSKADIWDGGHRVPFLVSWPGRVPQKSQCPDLICLTDCFATVADLLEKPVAENVAEDSFSFLPQLMGKASENSREEVVHHSVEGHFSIRDERWKLILCPGSGGWSTPKVRSALKQGLPTEQLYDMAKDKEETTNLASENPEIVAALRKELERLIARGRSTTGPKLTNDAPIVLEKWRK